MYIIRVTEFAVLCNRGDAKLFLSTERPSELPFNPLTLKLIIILMYLLRNSLWLCIVHRQTN